MSERQQEGEWKFDEHGKVSNRTLAEMIVSSLFYAKPPVISDTDYDRAVDIVEEEISVVEIEGREIREAREQRTDQDSQPSAGGNAE